MTILIILYYIILYYIILYYIYYIIIILLLFIRLKNYLEVEVEAMHFTIHIETYLLRVVSQGGDFIPVKILHLDNGVTDQQFRDFLSLCPNIERLKVSGGPHVGGKYQKERKRVIISFLFIYSFLFALSLSLVFIFFLSFFLSFSLTNS